MVLVSYIYSINARHLPVRLNVLEWSYPPGVCAHPYSFATLYLSDFRDLQSVYGSLVFYQPGQFSGRPIPVLSRYLFTVCIIFGRFTLCLGQYDSAVSLTNAVTHQCCAVLVQLVLHIIAFFLVEPVDSL